MLVLKFGGTSVGSAERIKKLVPLVNDTEKKVVVLSAMSGTTNSLVSIAEKLYAKDNEGANTLISALKEKYLYEVKELFTSELYLNKGYELVNYHFNYLSSFTQEVFTLFKERAVLAQGELLSTALFHFYLKEQGLKAELIPALHFMRIDKDGEPDGTYIKENLTREIEKHPSSSIFITQGFICRNIHGEIDNLKRGGSDYSASLIGAALKANEVQIWTDIDGMHNNDPRYVEDTHPLSQLSYDEAAELAYFGAKILHPSSVVPCQVANVPVRLKNTLKPDLKGTLISSSTGGDGIKAIAAKDNITAIKIKSGRMLLAHGFLRKVFEIFETYKTAIDMITTSEIAVSLTIDNTEFLNEIVTELKKYGTVEVDQGLSIVCIVGDFIAENKGYASEVFKGMKNIPIRMISYGGSHHNISLLVNTSDKKETLHSLNKTLFEKCLAQ